MWASTRGTATGSINMVQQDLRRGRPTEIGGYLNGLMIRKGREANVPTPMNEAVTELFLRVERGELRQDVSNLELLPSPPVSR
jgi:ketopantoate reductase